MSIAVLFCRVIVRTVATTILPPSQMGLTNLHTGDARLVDFVPVFAFAEDDNGDAGQPETANNSNDSHNNKVTGKRMIMVNTCHPPRHHREP